MEICSAEANITETRLTGLTPVRKGLEPVPDKRVLLFKSFQFCILLSILMEKMRFFGRNGEDGIMPAQISQGKDARSDVRRIYILFMVEHQWEKRVPVSQHIYGKRIAGIVFQTSGRQRHDLFADFQSGHVAQPHIG